MQGAVSPFTKESISSFRKWLPGAEIVLSTWYTEDVSGLDVDSVVLGIDPGHTPLNTKRQIVGTLPGIRAASNGKILKTRTDGILVGDGFVDHLGKWEERHGDFKIFGKRIVVPNVGTSDPDVHVCYQASDLAMFGTKADMEFLYDIPADPAEFTKLSTEQYIWMSAINKKFPVELEHILHRPPSAIINTKRFMADNVVVLNAREQFNLYCGRHVNVPDDEPVTMRHEKWKQWYMELPYGEAP